MLKELREGNVIGFKGAVKSRLYQIVEEKLAELKKLVAARYYSEDLNEKIDDQEEQLEILKQGDKKIDEVSPTQTVAIAAASKKKTKPLVSTDDPHEKAAKDWYDSLPKDNDKPKKKVDEDLTEANVQRMGRLKVVKIRIRKGKVQRRKKVSAVKGYTLRGGKLTRMKPTERRRRKMGARRAKFKRKGKLSRTRQKLKRSLRRRHSLGL